MRKFFYILIFVNLNLFGQNLYLKINGANNLETKKIDSLSFVKKHLNAKSVATEVNLVLNKLQKNGHGHLKKVIEDELLLRGSRDFDDLAAYRRFIVLEARLRHDEVVGRRNARNRRQIEIERAVLKELPSWRSHATHGHGAPPITRKPASLSRRPVASC